MFAYVLWGCALRIAAILVLFSKSVTACGLEGRFYRILNSSIE